MPIRSMTGFARSAGALDGLAWQWDVKSVNGKALDVRCRLPQGFEDLEAGARAMAQQALKRGNLQVALSVNGAGSTETIRLNSALLDQLVAAGEALRARIGGEALRADVMLGLRGVIDVAAPIEDEAQTERRVAAMLESFGKALQALVVHRREEGARLHAVVAAHVDRIAELTEAARLNPGRTPEAIRTRLAEQVARLMDAGGSFDPDRLHQEAMLLATRSDIQEEIDRLVSHVEAARLLLASDEAVGRKFDFLAQEFNREANTLCSKSTDRALTATGLELKTVIDQMREQIQNIE